MQQDLAQHDEPNEASLVTQKRQGAVLTLALNRPEALNAFNNELFDAFARAIIQATEDDSVKVIIVTGTGRAFSAGLDLSTVGQTESAEHGFSGVFDRLIACPKPILLAINGIGVGVGCTVCGLVDMVFMAESAKLRCPFTALGLTAEAASTITFPALMGHQAATWALLSSEWLDAETCQRLGVAYAVVADEQLLQEVQQHAQILAAQPLASLKATKELIMAPRLESMRVVAEKEGKVLSAMMGGPANREAIAAFQGKRAPDFSAF